MCRVEYESSSEFMCIVLIPSSRVVTEFNRVAGCVFLGLVFVLFFYVFSRVFSVCCLSLRPSFRVQSRVESASYWNAELVRSKVS